MATIATTQLSVLNARVMTKRAKSVSASQTYARVMGVRAVTSTRFSAINQRTMLRLTPNYRWIDMFLDIVFPNDISQNSDAATRFNTLVNQVASGHDQRVSLWDHPLMEYNVAYGVRTLEDLHDLIRFFRAVRGQLNSFRFLDKLDYTSNFATFDESREPDPITPFDQTLGEGDGVNLQFQLIKKYDFDTESTTRPIYKPIEGTVRVAVNGTEITNFTVNHSTGIITITPRVTKTLNDVTITNVTGSRWRLTVSGADAPRTLPSLPNVGEWITITGLGQTLARCPVLSAGTATQVDFDWTPTSGSGPFTAASVTLTTDNTPRIGWDVQAGFHFHVPCRFAIDRLPVRLEYYGIGSATEVKLVEVRPDQE